MRLGSPMQACVLAAVLGLLATAHAAGYPVRPVRLIAQGAPGSGPDVIVRIVTEQLTRAWGQPVLIVNHPGAGGLVAGHAAAAAEPDGYTLYAPTITTFVILPEMHDKLPFDLERDFTPVGLVAETPMMIAVAPALGVKSLAGLIALAKARPEAIFYAANNRGSLPHLTGELFRSRTGSSVTFVPYPGATAGLQDLAGGRVSMIVESVGALRGAAQAGTVTPLAVASPHRLPSLPDVPTAAETIPGFVAMGWVALLAPAATPAAIVQKVNEAVGVAVVQPEVRRKLEELGAYPRPLSPAQTATFVRAEQEAWGPRVREAGLKAQ